MNAAELNEIERTLDELELGAPQVHQNLALFPLVAPLAGARAQPAGYVLLDEALERNLARVTEVSKGGSVPELAFENSSAEKILLVDGDELVGAKQNRIINLSILVGAGRRIVIPVSCVEQGRWSYRSEEFSSRGRKLFAKARANVSARVSESLSATGRRNAHQGEVWESVHAKMEALETRSPTMSMGDAYEHRGRDLEAYARAFRAEPRQRGAVLAIDGNVAGMELFDAEATFSRYLKKLVGSYAMDALETGNRRPLAPPADEVRRFLDSLKAGAAERFDALGEGQDIRLKGKGVSGGALAAGGRVVHLAGYATAN
jgi:hypothetical protein